MPAYSARMPCILSGRGMLVTDLRRGQARREEAGGRGRGKCSSGEGACLVYWAISAAGCRNGFRLAPPLGFGAARSSIWSIVIFFSMGCA